ncbi:hypothetical protein [Porphyrobacter sp. YT40]|uniref:hypothetical protein n=1 Tax=Porphyrobacter sp. YT40 TaxID=2547601 RepID=UPI001142BE10|nr:hypothetical protein [Porphyrobacter sp. YT40]QDH33339.1 hypothetical protein E2E27_02705 [Porphyrobacter sp. YT40]
MNLRPFITRTGTLGAIAAVFAFSATPAMAQVSDSATVNANAELLAVTPPLSVTGTSDLEFGSLNIPNGVVSERFCVYDVPANGTPTRTVRETDTLFNVIDAVLPTPSNCDASGSFNPARFAVACSAATPTTFTAVIEDSGLNNGFILNSDGIRIAALHKGATNNGFVNSTISNTIVATCPDGFTSGTTAGELDILVGARLAVDLGAAANPSTTAGTITLTATY